MFPTCGRILHFFPKAPQEGSSLICLPAIVNQGHGADGMVRVDLTAFGPTGSAYYTGIELVEDGATSHIYPCCAWMAYQKGQAEYAKSLEKKLEEKPADPVSTDPEKSPEDPASVEA